MKNTPAWLPDWRTVLSAALIVVSFPPWNWTPLIWIALVPWFAALDRTPTVRRALQESVWLGFLVSLGGFYWVAYVLQQFAGLPLPVALIGLGLFSLIGQPQFFFYALLKKNVQRRIPAPATPIGLLVLATALALFFAGIDHVIPKLFLDTLGHSFYASEWIRQVADLGGASLLTFLIVFVNDTLWNLWHRLKTRTEPSAWPALSRTLPQMTVSLGLIAATLIYGHFRSKEINALIDAAPKKAQLAVIQANIGDFDKVAAERGVRGARERVLQTFFDMSDRALNLNPRPQALVWPETSYPSTFGTPQVADELASDQKLESYVRERGVPLYFGGYDQDKQHRDYNAFFFLSPKPNSGLGGESDRQVYRKNLLLLFGEYLPGAEAFPFLKRLFPQVANFGRGAGPDVYELPLAGSNGTLGSVKAGPAICYEVLFSNYVIAAARKGSQMILNITNDSWFGPSGEPHLHLALSTFRSVETRLPMLRSTNTGISALVLPSGSIAQATGIMQPEIMNVSVPLIQPVRTLMLAWGDWFGPTAFLVSLILITWLWKSRAKT